MLVANLQSSEECDGRVHTSTRVFHSGVHRQHCHHGFDGKNPHDCRLEEEPCRDGHFCGMGAVSGDRTQCECRPTQKVPDFPDVLAPTPAPNNPGLACYGGKVWTECASCDFHCGGLDNQPCDPDADCRGRCACPPSAPYWEGDIGHAFGSGKEMRCRTRAWCDLHRPLPKTRR